MGRNMFGIQIKVDPPSPEDLVELDRLFKKAQLMRAQETALWARQEQPLAGMLLRELLLDKIKPPGLQS
jgi:hypothetical protein